MSENEFGEPKLKLVKSNNNHKTVDREKRRVTSLDITTELPDMGNLYFFIESCTCCEGVSFVYYMEGGETLDPMDMIRMMATGQKVKTRKGETHYRKVCGGHLRRKWYRKALDFVLRVPFEERVIREAHRFHKNTKKSVEELQALKDQGDAIVAKFEEGRLL